MSFITDHFKTAPSPSIPPITAPSAMTTLTENHLVSSNTRPAWKARTTTAMERSYRTYYYERAAHSDMFLMASLA